MIVADGYNCRLCLPKVDRCKLSCWDIYQLIIQHKSTRQIFIFKVRDYAPCNPVRFHFYISFPQCMPVGEYDLFIVSGDIWKVEELDPVFPKKTTLSYTTDKTPVMIGGQFIVSDRKILMSSQTKAIIGDHFGALEVDGDYIITTIPSQDRRATGEIAQTECIDIIQTDLLKFMVESDPHGIAPENLRNQIHTEYKR